MRRTSTIWIGLVCFGLVSACGGGGGGEAAPPQRRSTEVTPEASSADPIGPLAPPAGFDEVSGDGFTLAAPAGFTTERRTSSNGEPMLRLTGDQGAGSLVAVIREARPRADAIEQSITLEKTSRVVDKATDVTRQEIEWPGAERAVLVQWTALDQQRGSTAEPFRTMQLLAQVNTDLIFSVVATAPATSFEQSQVANVLRTFRPRPAAS